MKRSTRLLLCLCLGSLLLVARTAAEYDDEEGEELPEDDDWKPEVIEAYDDSDVVVLTEDNYEEQLKSKEWALVRRPGGILRPCTRCSVALAMHPIAVFAQLPAKQASGAPVPVQGAPGTLGRC